MEEKCMQLLERCALRFVTVPVPHRLSSRPRRSPQIGPCAQEAAWKYLNRIIQETQHINLLNNGRGPFRTWLEFNRSPIATAETRGVCARHPPDTTPLPDTWRPLGQSVDRTPSEP